jgi:hypothetical protein
MRRLLWLGIGLAVGALAVRAVTKRARKLTPSGLAGSAKKSAGGFAGSIRSFMDDVREGMAEREQEIHAALAAGASPDAPPADDRYAQEGKHRR